MQLQSLTHHLILCSLTEFFSNPANLSVEETGLLGLPRFLLKRKKNDNNIPLLRANKSNQPHCCSPGKSLQAVSRSNSQMTLDSIDVMTRLESKSFIIIITSTIITIIRYSEDTDRKEEDRVAVLEYELRTAREALQQLKSEVGGLFLVSLTFWIAFLTSFSFATPSTILVFGQMASLMTISFATL